MSKAVQQFVDIVQNAYGKAKKTTTRLMYCMVCGTQTTHSISEQGLYEYYKCVHCGSTKSYKVK
jgi:DNA-directed RNA polymerase subunit RPC12/RpoP